MSIHPALPHTCALALSCSFALPLDAATFIVDADGDTIDASSGDGVRATAYETDGSSIGTSEFSRCTTTTPGGNPAEPTDPVVLAPPVTLPATGRTALALLIAVMAACGTGFARTQRA